jgi:Ca2+-binding EF-hand superfamily protein
MNKTLIIALTLAFSSFASANETAAVESSFSAFDVDQNGLISLNEASTNEALSVAFTNLDIDQNGDLSEDEFSKFIE